MARGRDGYSPVMVFDTERATRRLSDAGLDVGAAQGVADVVDSATSGLATEASLAALKAEMYRALWIQGAGIIAATAAIVAIATALG